MQAQSILWCRLVGKREGKCLVDIYVLQELLFSLLLKLYKMMLIYCQHVRSVELTLGEDDGES